MRREVLIAVCIFTATWLGVMFSAAQSAPVMEAPTLRMAGEDAINFPSSQVSLHWKEFPRSLRIAGDQTQNLDNHSDIDFELIVSPEGHVLQAKAVSGPQEFYEEAKQLMEAREYEPFMKNGRAVSARIKDAVSVRPLEVWATPRHAFPEVKDWSSVRIGLERSGCLGSCPAYLLTIDGAGNIDFDGRGFVAVAGKHHARISKEAVRGLVTAFRRADYFSLLDSYQQGCVDCPSYRSSIEFDGTRKIVSHEDSPVMPDAVNEIEAEIDKTADSARWVSGDEATVSSLRSEGWNFKLQDEGHANLIQAAVSTAPASVIQQLLAAGAQLPRKVDRVSALATAARRNDIEVVRVLLRAGLTGKSELSAAEQEAARSANVEMLDLLLGKGADPEALSSASEDKATVLMAAASSGNVDIVRNLLKFGAQINKTDDEGKTALMYAADADALPDNDDEDDVAQDREVAEVVKLLLDSGAKVDARDADGKTAIFSACFQPEALKTLLQAGASVNVADHDAVSPLIDCDWADSVKILLEHGADLWHRDALGRSALDAAREHKDVEKEKLLEEWMAGLH